MLLSSKALNMYLCLQDLDDFLKQETIVMKKDYLKNFQFYHGIRNSKL